MLQDRQRIAKDMNKVRNERMRDKFIERLQTSLQDLQIYAESQQIFHETQASLQALPLFLNAQNLKSKPVRDSAVKKYIQLAEQTLKEFSEIPARAFGEFHYKKIIDQEKSIRNLLGMLTS